MLFSWNWSLARDPRIMSTNIPWHPVKSIRKPESQRMPRKGGKWNHVDSLHGASCFRKSHPQNLDLGNLKKEDPKYEDLWGVGISRGCTCLNSILKNQNIFLNILFKFFYLFLATCMHFSHLIFLCSNYKNVMCCIFDF